jgi:hypothetical protein
MPDPFEEKIDRPITSSFYKSIRHSGPPLQGDPHVWGDCGVVLPGRNCLTSTSISKEKR